MKESAAKEELAAPASGGPVSNRTSGHKPPGRVDPLAVLPVFLNLEGRRVLVAGGTAAAAWKAELLKACGAEVHVYALDLDDAFTPLLRAGARGRLLYHRAPWAPGSLAGMSLAIGDCETQEDARAFAQAARDAGVPVNVIDKPAFCQFQFGSIVNRSPAVIAISTDGAAPILAQAIRRRIEAVLPPALKSWAELAKSIRQSVNDRLAHGRPRRAFWEAFVDRAFGTNGAAPSAAAFDTALEELAANPQKGRISIIELASHDPELLTLKAVRRLQAADLIVFDRGVADDILLLARREAERRQAEASPDTWRGTNIVPEEALLSDRAQAGEHVVLLTSRPVSKSAMLRFERHGIEAEILHSAAALPASAQVRTPPGRSERYPARGPLEESRRPNLVL